MTYCGKTGCKCAASLDIGWPDPDTAGKPFTTYQEFLDRMITRRFCRTHAEELWDALAEVVRNGGSNWDKYFVAKQWLQTTAV